MKLSNNEIRDEIELILEKASYAHGMANLIHEQKDFGTLPKHQQIAVCALGEFLFCVVNSLENLNQNLNQ